MSGIAALLAILGGALPITAGATRGMHERWRARWRLRAHARIEDAREGDLVYASGIVRALDETLVAPLSGKPCVAYRARARGESRARRGTMTLWQETMQIRPFAIERDDGTGTIVVVGDRAVFGLAAQPLVPRNPDREASFLARHAIAQGRARLVEHAVEVGAHVAVGGTLVLVPRETPPTEERGFRDLPSLAPQITGNRDAPLVIVARRR